MSNDNGGTFVSLVFELKWDITVIDKTHDSSYLWTGQYFYPIRSSRPEVFCKKGILRPATLLKRTRLWRRCFPVSFAKFLWIHIFTEYLPWLLLSYSKIGGQNQIFTVNLIAQSLYYIIFLYRQARLRKQKEVEIFVAEMDIWRFCWGGGRGGGILGQTNEKINTQIKTQDLNERYLHMLENCLLSFIALINYNNYYLLHKRLNCKAYLRQKKQAKIQMKSCVFLKICFFGFECKNIKTHSKENHKLIFSAEAYA